MIGSISSSMSSAMMARGTQQSAPLPKNENAFTLADSDGNGVVSETELENVVEAIAETTGADLTTEDLLSYDADEDGGLSGEEMLSMLNNNGFNIPTGSEGGQGHAGGPPPPSAETALSAYADNSGSNNESLVSELISNMLTDLDSSSTEQYSIDISS